MGGLTFKKAMERGPVTELMELESKGPVAEPDPELLEEAREQERKKATGRRGRGRHTVITGELEPETTKKSLLG